MNHVPNHGWTGPPPRTETSRRLAMGKLWEEIPEPNRKKIIQALGRLIAQTLATPPTTKEVPYECD